jgi:[ribosomal protein S5]-alanine N-acetyltransferase
MRTPRLEMMAMNLATMEAELTGPEVLSALLGVAVPVSWPPGEFDRDAILYFQQRLRESPTEEAAWYGWYVFRIGPVRQRVALVGAVGYFGPPVEGSVEVGYSVIAEARNQGIATECVEALIERAFSFPQVKCVIAHTRDDTNVASTKVLRGCGFRRIGPGREPGLTCYQCDRVPTDQASHT